LAMPKAATLKASKSASTIFVRFINHPPAFRSRNIGMNVTDRRGEIPIQG
jgi:hypothetical protein